jgi:putative (di)nucleoside polyphosphate hydrolase
MSDEGEEPWATALRELEEETGIAPHLVDRIAECPERIKYDLPAELRGKLWDGQSIGQHQDWHLARFLASGSGWTAAPSLVIRCSAVAMRVLGWAA